ncbi:hypothetical protein OG462_42830 [Streptomyces sp. NBC_01077]|uniref:DinB/UmuC family translesion DNA polymerase n=1 Tax=Streptomyces sp. NBC_01077 TaxID=2903746 RepID=UPI0038693364|nr:hypothetical protein OG462_02195 [Streptomyces sp. NBC_01077]WSV43553.1 hypothetical protein OG462_42830 [Streptomyces sp. NBC_01077]
MPESTSAFDRDVYGPVLLVRATLLDLTTTLGQRIRGRGSTARKLTLAVLFADGSTTERTLALPQPSAHTDDLRVSVFRSLDSMAFQRADPPPRRDRRRSPPRRRRPRHTDLPDPRRSLRRQRAPALGSQPRFLHSCRRPLVERDPLGGLKLADGATRFGHRRCPGHSKQRPAREEGPG